VSGRRADFGPDLREVLARAVDLIVDISRRLGDEGKKVSSMGLLYEDT
jgi:hypothetical protein